MAAAVVESTVEAAVAAEVAVMAPGVALTILPLTKRVSFRSRE